MSEDDLAGFSLALPDPERAEQKVKAATEVSPELKQQIESVGGQQAMIVMGADLSDPTARARVRKTVETLGAKNASVSAAKSKMLDTRIRTLAQSDSGNTKLAADLQNLTIRVRELDPSRVNFQRQGFLGKLFKPTERYLEQFRTAREEIDDIIVSLTNSAETLRQNNIAIDGYEADIYAESKQIAADIEMANDFEAALVAAIDKAKAEGIDPEKIRFIENDVLFPLEQRRQDLQSLLAVNQQAGISLSILRETNSTLIQNVNRTTRITVRALDTGVMLQRALADQKAALEQTKAVREATEAIISANAEALHQQSREIRDMASEAVVNPEVLQKAFDELFQTLEEGDAWRQAAIPRMQQTIDVLQDMSTKAQMRIDRIQETKALPEG